MGLLSAVKGWINPEPAPAPVRPRVSRAVAVPAAPVPEGFSVGDEVWLYQPSSMHLRLVDSLGATEGVSLNQKQAQDLKRLGVCVEAHFYSSPAHYWRQPSHKAIMTMIEAMGLRTPSRTFAPESSLKAKSSEGLWVRVRFEEYVEPEAAEHQLAPL